MSRNYNEDVPHKLAVLCWPKLRYLIKCGGENILFTIWICIMSYNIRFESNTPRGGFNSELFSDTEATDSTIPKLPNIVLFFKYVKAFSVIQNRLYVWTTWEVNVRKYVWTAYSSPSVKSIVLEPPTCLINNLASVTKWI